MGRIADEANAKRSESAKAQPRTETGFSERPKQVDEQSVQPPAKQAKARKAKAGKAGVNSGAIMRAEALQAARPDLAEKVRTGEVKPAEARRLPHLRAQRLTVHRKDAPLPITIFYRSSEQKERNPQSLQLHLHLGRRAMQGVSPVLLRLLLVQPMRRAHIP